MKTQTKDNMADKIIDNKKDIRKGKHHLSFHSLSPHFTTFHYIAILILFFSFTFTSCETLRNFMARDLEDEDFIIGQLYADELVERFGVDAMRWYVLAEMPYAADGTISYENIITRYNADLANVLGNLVNRTHAMITKYFDGAIPAAGELNDTDRDLIETAKSVVAQYTEKMDGLCLAEAIATIITLLRRSNKYIDETEPWALSKKGETERLGTVLYNLSEAIRVASVLIRPFMPTTADKVFAMYNTNENSF